MSCLKSQCDWYLPELVHPSASPRTLFAMIKFYMDESGLGKNRDDKVCSIAGFVAPNSSWKGFHKQCSKILSTYHLDEFKSKEFWTRRPDGGLDGKYASWTFKDANNFMAKLLQLLFSYKPRLFAGSVKLMDFFSYSEAERRYLTGAKFHINKREFMSTGKPNAAYFAAFNMVVIKGLELAKRDGEVCHFIFDEQTEFAPLAVQRIREIRENPSHASLAPFLGDGAFSRSINLTPLQVADLAAFTCKEYYKNIMYEKPVKFPDRAVVTPIEVFHTVINRCRHELYSLQRADMDKILKRSNMRSVS